MMTEREKAALAIKERYGSIHAFCVAHSELPRTTVYAVLGGSYGGDEGRQLGRIFATLDESTGGQAQDMPGLTELEEVIRDAACQRCPVPTAQCRRCAPQHLLMAQAVLALLENRAKGGRDD